MADEGPDEQPTCTLPAFSGPVTAVAAAPVAGPTGSSYVLAVGLEDGGLEVWGVDLPSGSSQRLWEAPDAHRHAAAVQRLRWAPIGSDAAGAAGADAGVLLLGSCSDDHSVRLFAVSW